MIKFTIVSFLVLVFILWPLGVLEFLTGGRLALFQVAGGGGFLRAVRLTWGVIGVQRSRMGHPFFRSPIGGLVLYFGSPLVFVWFLIRNLILDWRLGTLQAWNAVDDVVIDRVRGRRFEDATEFEVPEETQGSHQLGGVPPVLPGEAPPPIEEQGDGSD